jgi:hypothetical protein
LLDQKVTKNQVSRKASLPHKAFARQITQNLGPDDFALRLKADTRHPGFSKILMPLQPHNPTSFCLISPEAVLLTGKHYKCNHIK